MTVRNGIIPKITQVIGGVSVDGQIDKSAGEYRVRVRLTGSWAWYAAGEYFTTDKVDAQATRSRMMMDYAVKVIRDRERLAAAASSTTAVL